MVGKINKMKIMINKNRFVGFNKSGINVVIINGIRVYK